MRARFSDPSGVVTSVLGVVHAVGELRPALVRRGHERYENGRALDDVRAGLGEEGEELLVPRLHPEADVPGEIVQLLARGQSPRR
jgi:hypothetical protein